jgi:hypothetical protein
VLTGGRIVFDGDPGELMRRHARAETLEEAYGRELATHGSTIGSVE